jgi:hypothetical protein
MDPLEQECANRIAGIDQTIHEAVWQAARLYLAAGVPHAELQERIRPFVTRLVELRMQAVAQLEANLVKMRVAQMQLALLERLESEVVH